MCDNSEFARAIRQEDILSGVDVNRTSLVVLATAALIAGIMIVKYHNEATQHT